MTNETSTVDPDNSAHESADPAAVEAVSSPAAGTVEPADITSGSAVAPAAGAPQDDDAPRTGVSRLEEEGDVAADYLEELLDIADLDGDIDIDVENGRASLAIVAPDGAGSLRRLVGPNGEVLDALQELARLAVQAQTGERSRLMLDIADHRADRKRELSALAAAAVADVRASGERRVMDPMNPFERKVVHDAVAEAGLSSESEGEEPRRCVVILPAD